jgi:uncharacterized small protein (DUF1192 family)
MAEPILEFESLRRINFQPGEALAMPAFDDDMFGTPRKAPAAHEIGQAIEALSVHELAERIELLKAEIVRLEAAIKARQATKDAAGAFFKS